VSGLTLPLFELRKLNSLGDTVGHPPHCFQNSESRIDSVVTPPARNPRHGMGTTIAALSIAKSRWLPSLRRAPVHSPPTPLGERSAPRPWNNSRQSSPHGPHPAGPLPAEGVLQKKCQATHTMIPPNYPVVGHDASAPPRAFTPPRSSKPFKNDLRAGQCRLRGVPRTSSACDQVDRDRSDERQVPTCVLAREALYPADDAVVTRSLTPPAVPSCPICAKFSPGPRGRPH